MSQSKVDDVIALAGVFQAALLVNSLAKHGKGDLSQIKTAIHSIVNQSTSLENIFISVQNLKHGAINLKKYLELPVKDLPQFADPLRYIISMIHIAKKIINNKIILENIYNVILKAKSQIEIFGIDHDNVTATLGDLYTENIGSLSHKIYIRGQEALLKNVRHMNKVRAMLLAGVRAAVLWRQLGGSRFKLIIQRKTLLKQTNILLSNLNVEQRSEVV